MTGTPFGRYRLVEVLGRGGMGEVWRAYDPEMDRVVALKVLPTHFAGNREYQERFRREARSAAGLDEPHVVPIYDFGEIEGRLYVTMRLIRGRDLQILIDDGPLSPQRAVAIVEQIGSALHAAHEIGLVHRDVKPSNILVAEDDFAYLIDFGIARTAEDFGLTSTDVAIGTWAYMAPERLNTGNATAAADTYALACVLYEALTGQVPFPGESIEQQIVGHLTSPPPRPSAIQRAMPEALDAVIATGMAKEPERRYATCRELTRAARDALSSSVSVPPRRVNPSDRAHRTTHARAAAGGNNARAEFKQVTVLCAEVVESMDIAFAIGAERLHEIMTDLADHCTAVVERYGGMVDKFTGDGFTAVFGAPIALEDHAIRACAAALGIQEEARRLSAEVHARDSVDVRLRVALNSGQVVAGEIGSGPLSYTAIGEQVGMAQRMLSVAPPAGIMLSSATARLVDSAATLDEGQRIQIRGITAPVNTHQLLGMGERRRPARNAEPNLVGRQWESSTIEGLLERAIDGRGAVICMVGSPGVGKSRLVRELSNLAADRDVDVIAAFCESLNGAVPFYAVTRLLRAALGVSDLDAPAARVQVRTRLPDADPEDLLLLDDLLEIADPNAELPVIDPDARRRRLTALINAASMGRKTPAVYVIEDIHWIDEVSESMLAEFLTVIPQTPSLVLVTYRPEYQGALSRAPGSQTVTIAPLSDSVTARLVAELVGSDPSMGRWAAVITEKAAGNPFFAEELVRDLAERGVLVGERGAYVAATDAGEVSVPASLQAAIAARIDRLDPVAKRTLNAAAVIGARFSLELLKTLGAEPVCDHLIAAELIDQITFTRQPEYAFHHPLIRAVAYEAQLKADRGQMHRRLASAIELRDQGSSDQNAALVAEHLEAAGDKILAYGWHMRAAAWAMNRNIAAARMSWERAKTIADGLPADEPNGSYMRIAPRTMLCGSAWRAHESVAGGPFEELRELCAGAGDKGPLAIGMVALALEYAYQAHLREASPLASEAMNLIESIRDETLTVGMSVPLVYVKSESGEWSDALQWSQRVIELSDGDPSKGSLLLGISPLAAALPLRALARCCLGHAGWSDDIAQGLAVARDADPLSYGLVVGYVYFPGVMIGSVVPDDSALSEIEAAVQTAERSSDDLALTFARVSWGVALVHRPTAAERERGEELLTEVSDVFQRGGHNLGELPVVHTYLARERARRGDLDGAIPVMRVAVDDLAREGQLLAWGIPATGVLVETLLDRGTDADVDEADAAVQRLADAPTDGGFAMLDIWLLRLHALLARARGDAGTYAELRDRYCDTAKALGYEGHIVWAEAMQ